VREKKRFENALDESVAGGLNAGTEVLMKEARNFDGTATILFSSSQFYLAGGAYYIDTDKT
jgi:hypothetical protein